MPQLTFPVSGFDLIIPVVVGLDGTTTAALLAAGQAVPRPLLVSGEIDTGSNITCISAGVLQRVAARSTQLSSAHSTVGVSNVKLFIVSLSIVGPLGNAGPTFVQSDLEVMEPPYLPQGRDVLIGMDVLLQCQLLIDGPARQFTLSF